MIVIESHDPHLFPENALEIAFGWEEKVYHARSVADNICPPFADVPLGDTNDLEQISG